MSDEIKHECGLAYIRLRKPFSYYLQKHGTVTYGLNKLYLLMEKQHNRGQDGAGIAAVKLNTEPGNPFLHRMRSNAPQPIADIFFRIGQEVQELEKYQPDIKHGQQFTEFCCMLFEQRVGSCLRPAKNCYGFYIHRLIVLK